MRKQLRSLVFSKCNSLLLFQEKTAVSAGLLAFHDGRTHLLINLLDLQWFLVCKGYSRFWLASAETTSNNQQLPVGEIESQERIVDCNFPRVAICYNNCFTFIKERRKFILHFTKYDMFNGTWSWLLIDELGLSSRVRDMNKFCWEGTFEKLPVVSVATNIHHFLFILLSFHRRLLNCGQQASTSTLSLKYTLRSPLAGQNVSLFLFYTWGD